MKFNIFSKAESKKRLPLKHYINGCKEYHGDDIFVKIWNDLDTDTFVGDSFAEMAYAYARRTIAVFLYLQGHFNSEEIALQQKVFQHYQIKTDGSYEFQEEAAAASYDFLREYSKWFTNERISTFTTLVFHGRIVDIKSLGQFHTADEVIEKVTDVLNQMSR